jgi:hypothetical protein
MAMSKDAAFIKSLWIMNMVSLNMRFKLEELLKEVASRLMVKKFNS